MPRLPEPRSPLTNPSHSTLHTPTDTATRYVRSAGSNSDDGLSWQTAKKDILGAWDVLPSSGGRILYESGAYVDATNTNRGLWVAGVNDSNYAGTVPTGWRKMFSSGTLVIEGVPTVHVGGSRRALAVLNGGSTTDTTKPLFWFSGMDKSVEIRNVGASTALALPMELGKDSGTGLYTNNSGFVFDNVYLTCDTGNASHGPCINATSTYWTYFRDCTFYGNSAAAQTTDNRAVFLMPGTSGSYHNLIYFRDTNFNKGGGVVSKVTSSLCTLSLKNIVQEAPADGNSAPIFWWNAVTDNETTTGQVLIESCAQADQGAGADALVKVNALNDPSLVAVAGPGTVDGPCTILGQGARSGLTSPGSKRANGVFGRRIIGQQDSARRTFAPTAARAVNLANTDGTAWSGLTGSATVTTGQAAPDGSSNAVQLASASQQNKRVVSTSRTVAVGDWVIAGVWARPTSGAWPAAMPEVDWSASDDLFDASAAGVNFFVLRAPWSAASKEWVWLSAAYKVTQASTTPSTLIFFLFSDGSATMHYYAPVCLHIASGTYPDAEVLEMARHLGNWPNTAAAGQVAVLQDTNIQIPRGYIEIGNMTGPAAPSDNYVRLYADTSGGKDRVVARFATGAVQVIATEP